MLGRASAASHPSDLTPVQYETDARPGKTGRSGRQYKTRLSGGPPDRPCQLSLRTALCFFMSSNDEMAHRNVDSLGGSSKFSVSSVGLLSAH